MCVSVGVCMPQHTIRGQLFGRCSFLPPRVLGIELSLLGLHSKYLHLLSHLAGPHLSILDIISCAIGVLFTKSWPMPVS